VPDFQIRKTLSYVVTVTDCKTPQEALEFVHAFSDVLEEVLVWEVEEEKTSYSVTETEVPF
jgi:hypothetical protein